MRAYERLLKYVKVHTTSDEASETVPSTARQFDLARLLAEEMRGIGFEDVSIDGFCNVYGTLPTCEGYEGCPAIGLIAHLDTSPDADGENVKPQLWENYDGGDVALADGRVLSPSVFPKLSELAGRTLITSDGTTLLGADDKAGIAEIMTLAERLITEAVPHGKLCVAFTPDEEIGHGASSLDLVKLGADYAYTVDGGAENEIEYENFNAAKAVFTVTGKSVHPGEAKNKMVNAAIVANEIVSMLPSAERPEHTEKREGFYHLTAIQGSVERAEAVFIVRDHDQELFEAKKKTLRLVERTLNEAYGDGTVTLSITDQYRNMIEKIRPHMHLVEHAKDAMRAAGLVPVEVPIRGGTDGAQLSFRGLPCPNLGTGGFAFHGPYEHITAEGMDAVVEVLIGIMKSYAVKKETAQTYGFYGWENADAVGINPDFPDIHDPRELYTALSKLWCADTCAPRMRAEWTEENKTLGQCSVTAFLAQDIFGGEVYGILRPGGNYHCYNVVGDCVFDLTSEQFGDEVLSYIGNPLQTREEHFAKEEKKKRYEFLREALLRQQVK